MKKVAFLDTVHEILWDGLSVLGWECIDLTQSSEEQIQQILDEVHGIVIRSRFRMDESFLSKASQLEFIARSGAGMENIDIDYCERRGITLFNAPEGNRNAVAEHALGMLLSLFNQLNKADREVRAGIWDREGNRGVELEGKTVGIIGFGNNGSAFAKVLRGFDCEVLAYDKYKSGFGAEEVQEVDLNTLMSRSDIVSFHVPQTEETIGYLNKQFIQDMSKSFYVLNLSRGKVVSSHDLVEGIKNGKILGACLDVLDYEKPSFENMFDGDVPPDIKFLFDSDKTLLSPHVGGWTKESYRKLSSVLLEKIKSHYVS